MNAHVKLDQVLFLDIECVGAVHDFNTLDSEMQSLWTKKARSIQRNPALTDEEAAGFFEERAGIYAEFGKIVCISVGILRYGADGTRQLHVTSFADRHEPTLLTAFADMLERNAQHAEEGKRLRYLCGHNVREFDLPYIGRRMLIQRMRLPEILDLRGKKPWETKHVLDTMEVYSFGDRKAFTSLRLLAALFGIPSPKGDIDGSEVGRVFWEEDDLERIARYCERDVVATTSVYLALTGHDTLSEEEVRIR